MSTTCCPNNYKKNPFNSSAPELADIFKTYGDDFAAVNTLTSKQKRVMKAIRHCRDGKFGYHVDVCDNCGHKETANNSCRDRHCPKCSGISRKRWVNSRLKDILPIPYYHVVFTLPHNLFPLSLFNAVTIYDLLFSCAAATLKQFANDPEHLGAKIGFYGILHTWGGKLWQHLHIHFIVTGGGLKPSGEWKNLRYKGKFIFPVKALSKVFRGKFIENLKAAHKAGQLNFPGELKKFERFEAFNQWILHTFPKKWVVFAKKPFKSPKDVVKYIGRYTHRVAISNNRIKSMDNGRVCFSFKNYRKKGRWEEATLEIPEFIKRFLYHVLPEGYHRIRYYGLFANGQCRKNVDYIKKLLGSVSESDKPEEAFEELITCPKCEKGKLIPVYSVLDRITVILNPMALVLLKRTFNWDTS